MNGVVFVDLHASACERSAFYGDPDMCGKSKQTSTDCDDTYSSPECLIVSELA